MPDGRTLRWEKVAAILKVNETVLTTFLQVWLKFNANFIQIQGSKSIFVYTNQSVISHTWGCILLYIVLIHLHFIVVEEILQLLGLSMTKSIYNNLFPAAFSLNIVYAKDL